ncbi:hypothetical protein Droror1_Dr00026757 [Drosera rotundifolia]
MRLCGGKSRIEAKDDNGGISGKRALRHPATEIERRGHVSAGGTACGWDLIVEREVSRGIRQDLLACGRIVDCISIGFLVICNGVWPTREDPLR